MKILLTLLFLSFSLVSLSQKEYNFSPSGSNNSMLSVGAGYSLYYEMNMNNISNTSPVINIKYEYGVNEKFGFGINLSSYNATIERFNSNYSTKSILIRVNYHPNTNKKAYFYAGSGIGYRYANYDKHSNYIGDDYAKLPIGFEFTLGIRYFPTKHIGLYTEIGLAKSIIQGGVVIKF